MNKLQKRIREVEEEHAEEVLTEHLISHAQKRRESALMFLSGINVANRISQALSAESMRALIRFQEDKEYEAFGYDNFVVFLNESEFAPMTKSQFYERKAILEKEGDAAFDLLNNLSMPVAKRKLLGKGNIQLSGDTVIVSDQETGEEVEIEIKDRARLLETLTALADAGAEKTAKITKQEKNLEKQEQKIESLKEEIERVKTAKALELKNPHSDALMSLVGAFANLQLEVEQLSAIEKEQFAPRTFSTIAGLMNRLSEAYDRKKWENEVSASDSNPQPKDETDEIIDKFFDAENDSELADLM